VLVAKSGAKLQLISSEITRAERGNIFFGGMDYNKYTPIPRCANRMKMRPGII
jgi:hypothetical protein